MAPAIPLYGAEAKSSIPIGRILRRLRFREYPVVPIPAPIPDLARHTVVDSTIPPCDVTRATVPFDLTGFPTWSPRSGISRDALVIAVQPGSPRAAGGRRRTGRVVS